MGSKQIDIAIIGAGAAGLTLAALLGQSGLNVVIVDPKKPPAIKDIEPNGRTVALMNASLNILKHCDVWDVLKDQANPLEMMRIYDGSISGQEPVEVEFPANDIGIEQFGFNVPNDLLRAALFETIQKLPNVEFVEDAFDSFDIEKSDVNVRLASKKSILAKLLVGADGRHSAVRACAGIDIDKKEYDQSALTFIINHSRAHQNISTEFHRENGPMALVPMPGNQCAVVWVETKARAQDLIKLKKSEFEQAVQDKTHNILGGITLETGPQAWPLCSIKAKSLTAERVALVAEAAHVMSPITAQGLNLSLRDVAALAEEILDAARLGLDIGSPTVLKTYEKRRRTDIETRTFGVDGMNRAVSSSKQPLKELRRAGLKSLDMVLPLKIIAMQVGLSPKMDEGRLARGEAL